MNPIQEYLDCLTETDLTFVNPRNHVASMLGVPEKIKSAQISKKEKAFIENLKVLRENEGRTDLKGKSLLDKYNSINRKLIKEILKIRKAASIDGEILKEYEEFLALEHNQNKDLFQFVAKEVRTYKRYISVFTSPEQKASEIVKQNPEEFTEAITWEIEDKWTVEDFEKQFGVFLECNGLKIEKVSLKV